MLKRKTVRIFFFLFFGVIALKVSVMSVYLKLIFFCKPDILWKKSVLIMLIIQQFGIIANRTTEQTDRRQFSAKRTRKCFFKTKKLESKAECSSCKNNKIRWREKRKKK